ncbi:MAG TPA: RdgB/HAM1 family non-canonical purine NTP pyrophosphatase [Spirochaetota bacterium]|nr:RdgB/HAM1 family non-canonical purine NTP pyrophosphatase [Spirochaetota bacterium]
MKEIIIATNNKGKIEEFNDIFENKVILRTLKEVGFEGEIIENGNTFIENALIKCKTIYDIYKKPVLADDSGLCVNALEGAPGVFSARYGDEGLTDKDRYLLLLKNLEGKNDRTAAFVCALVLYKNPNQIYVIQEEFKGEITKNPRGENGFGYDPVFFLKDYDKTVAELPNEIKNKISHRAKASFIMKKIIFAL